MSDPREADAEHNARMKQVKAAQDAEVRKKTIKRGILLVHTGDGKGKSTSAFGTAIRLRAAYTAGHRWLARSGHASSSSNRAISLGLFSRGYRSNRHLQLPVCPAA